MARSFHGVDVSGATSGGPDRASARRRDWVQAQLPSAGSAELKDSLGSWEIPWPKGRDRTFHKHS